MPVVPNLDARRLGEMIPGELIRLRFRGRLLLSIVAGCDFFRIASGLVVVLLEDHPDRIGMIGRFLPIDEHMMPETALSYGTSHAVVVDPAAPVVAETDERFGMSGALLIGAGVQALRSRVAKDEPDAIALNIDVGSWKAVRPLPLPHRPPWWFAVLGWELRLLPGIQLDPPLPPVFTFRAGG